MKNQITHEAFISKEAAKELKRLCFDEPCAHFCNDDEGSILPAPTQQRVNRWLLEQHNFFISIDIDPASQKHFVANLYKKNDSSEKWVQWDRIGRCEDPIEANERAIVLALKYINCE